MRPSVVITSGVPNRDPRKSVVISSMLVAHNEPGAHNTYFTGTLSSDVILYVEPLLTTDTTLTPEPDITAAPNIINMLTRTMARMTRIFVVIVIISASSSNVTAKPSNCVAIVMRAHLQCRCLCSPCCRLSLCGGTWWRWTRHGVLSHVSKQPVLLRPACPLSNGYRMMLVPLLPVFRSDASFLAVSLFVPSYLWLRTLAADPTPVMSEGGNEGGG